MVRDLRSYHFVLIISLVTSVMMLLGGCLTQSPPVPPVATQDAPSGWYTVYFTDPLAPWASTYRGGPDEAIEAAIRAARLSVDAAIYDLNLWSVQNALIDAHRRGLQVRVVTESDNLDEPEIQALIEAGVPVLGDRREGFMHHKFVVIDSLEIWTGSMNFTTQGAYLNDNNLVRVRSSRLAQDYIVEFEEMFVDDMFGPASRVNTPYPSVTVDGTTLEIYFSPEDGTRAHLLELINEARNSIYFMAYSFTSDEIAEALLARAADGVDVRGVFEEIQYRSNIGTEYDRLFDAGLDVRLDGNQRNMHHKVMILDEHILVTGSYNFSANAEDNNDENTLIFYSPEIAAVYLEEFGRVYAQASQ